MRLSKKHEPQVSSAYRFPFASANYSRFKGLVVLIPPLSYSLPQRSCSLLSYRLSIAPRLPSVNGASLRSVHNSTRQVVLFQVMLTSFPREVIMP